MDLDQTLDNEFSGDFAITAEIRDFLGEAAKWANFLAIIGFIGLGFMVLAGLFMGTLMGSMPGAEEMPFPVGILSFFYIVVALIYFFPILYLYRFAKNMKIALRSDDQVALSLSFSNLKAHYKFIGILMAILLGFYALMIVFGLLAGGMAFMG